MYMITKQPLSKNFDSGNVSFSYEEFYNSVPGVTALRVIFDGEVVDVTVQSWMKECAVRRSNYVLLPFSPDSKLCDGKF